jgi:hypothetical protein
LLPGVEIVVQGLNTLAGVFVGEGHVVEESEKELQLK